MGGRGAFVSLGGAIETRGSADRRLARATASAWRRVNGGERTIVALGLEGRARWIMAARYQLDARLGWDGVTTGAGAPRALWPGAGTGQGRDGLLRAHPLIRDGIVDGAAFAPALATAGVELDRWFGGAAALAGAAAFIDAAVITAATPVPAARRGFVDAGAGLRFRAPGDAGRLRLDVATSLTDAHRAISVAWERPWTDTRHRP
jgi:hypothetical protein